MDYPKLTRTLCKQRGGNISSLIIIIIIIIIIIKLYSNYKFWMLCG